MDERAVTELFRSAASDVPPPAFDAHDIAAASRRADARKRRAVLTGSASGVGVLIAAAITLPLVFGGQQHSQSADAAAPSVVSGAQQPPLDGTRSGRPGSPIGPLVERGGTTCGRFDQQLAIALSGELPSRPISRPAPATADCPAGTRSASFQVEGGTVAALIVPAGSDLPRLSGPNQAHATASGAVVIVFTTAAPGKQAPLAGRLAGMAEHLAARF
ncbi:MAG: hypothetical protein ACRDRN_00910 [Sciscionella sp.]